MALLVSHDDSDADWVRSILAEEHDQIIHGHEDELRPRIGHAPTLRDDNPDRGIIVQRLDVRLSDPFGGLDLAAVILRLDDDLLAESRAHSTQVTPVRSTRLDAPVDPVVNMLGEVVGDAALEPRTSSLG